VKLLKFWADWCAPCHKTEPVFAELEAEFADRLEFVRVNIDEQPEVARHYRIMTVPAILLINETGAVMADLSSLAAFKTRLRSRLLNHLEN